jgi:hypothetical protein
MPVAIAHRSAYDTWVAMTHTSVSDPLFDLVEAIEEHAQRQMALIDCVRTLRAFLGPVPTSDGAYQAFSPTLIGSEPLSPLPTFQPPPPPPVHAPSPKEISLEVLAESPPGLLVRALRRDYDYFTELDEKLARLSIDLSTQEVDDVHGWPETGIG